METEHHTAPEDSVVDRRLAEALDLYADKAPPPGLNAMADRARRHEGRLRGAVLSVAAIAVFAAGWVSDEWITRPYAPASGEVAELIEADRDWDAQIEFASLEDVTLDGVAPAPLTELGLYLSRTETLRAESGVLQRMRYRARDGRRVSVVLKREVQVDAGDIRFVRHQGREIAHWSDNVFSVGVIGDLPRDDLQQIAERVRSHLDQADQHPAQLRGPTQNELQSSVIARTLPNRESTILTEDRPGQ
jgi:anti-sigma factor RsiW